MKAHSNTYAALIAKRGLLAEQAATAPLPETGTAFAHASDQAEVGIADFLSKADIAMREAEAEGRRA